MSLQKKNKTENKREKENWIWTWIASIIVWWKSKGMKTFHQFTIRVFQSWFEILNRLAASGDSLQEIYCDCMYIMYIRRLSM